MLLPIFFAISAIAQDSDYSQGGDNWTETLCATGDEQSPIDFVEESVTSTTSNDDVKVEVSFTPFTGQFGKTAIDLSYGSEEPFGTFTINNETFQIVNIHFHAPSEHTINGKSYPAELHLFGSGTGERYLEVGLLYEEGSEDGFIKKAYDSTGSEQTFDLGDVFGDGEVEGYYYYEGSLSAPVFGDCFENTAWIVFSEIKELSKDQLSNFTSMWAENPNFANGRGNNRKVQPLNGRTVYLRESSYLALLGLGVLIIYL